MPAPRLLALVALVGLVSSSCGGSDSAVCTEVREVEDPLSGTHVIAGTAVTFSEDAWPPTSGPHLALPPPEGVLTAPIEPTAQIRILESGAALIQYDVNELASGDVTVGDVEALAGDGVVVAPGERLPAAIVATAWTWKLTCTELDSDAIDDFARSRPDDAPGSD